MQYALIMYTTFTSRTWGHWYIFIHKSYQQVADQDAQEFAASFQWSAAAADNQKNVHSDPGGCFTFLNLSHHKASDSSKQKTFLYPQDPCIIFTETW
jgi:hypothetical protein